MPASIQMPLRAIDARSRHPEVRSKLEGIVLFVLPSNMAKQYTLALSCSRKLCRPSLDHPPGRSCAHCIQVPPSAQKLPKVHPDASTLSTYVLRRNGATPFPAICAWLLHIRLWRKYQHRCSSFQERDCALLYVQAII